MKRRYFFCLVILLFVLAACTKKEEGNALYIDTSTYEGTQQEVLDVVNQRVEYFNMRDKELYATVFTKDSSQSDIDAYEGIETQIIRLSEPKFMAESKSQVTVSIHEEYKNSPYGEVGDTMYTLMKEDGKWKINGID